MGNWLGRILGTSRAQDQGHAAGPVPAARAAPESPWSSWGPALDVDAEFCHWLIGGERSADQAAELAVLRTLEAQASNAATAALVPRVPAVVPQILQTLRDPSRPMSVLARQLGQDPVLVASVLRIAQSPYHGLGKPVTSLEQALLVVGQDGLRQMLASVAFRPIINVQSGEFSRRGAPRLWDQSERCGLACQVLAPAAGVSAFESFLGAVLQSVGMVVVLRLLDALARQPFAATPHMCAGLVAQSRRLACSIGRQWAFPENVIRAVTEQDPACAAQGRTALGDLLRISAGVSKLRVLADAGVIAEDDARLDLAANAGVQRCFAMLDAAPG